MQNLDFSSWTLDTRPFLIILGVIFLLGYLFFRLRPHPKLDQLESSIQKHFVRYLTGISLLFFTIGLLSKVSQYWTAHLNGQDFWLFADAFESMASGYPFLTRFAPHGTGWIQHGAVHPTWILYLFFPIAALFGGVAAALLWNPFFLTLGGVALGFFAHRVLDPTRAILLVLAFFVCQWVSTALSYDTHFETAYPFFIFLLLYAWSLPTTAKSKWALTLASVLGLMTIKLEAIFLLLPLVTSLLYFDFKHSGPNTRTIRSFKWHIITVAWGIVLSVLLIYTLKKFGNHDWTPTAWQGWPVTIPSSVGIYQGVQIEHWGDLFLVFKKYLLARNLHTLGLIREWTGFLVSRPFLALIFLAPWLVRSLTFWIAIFPISFVYSLIGGLPSRLALYYALPFLCLIWVGMVLHAIQNKRPWFIIWTLGAALLLGGGNPVKFYFPNVDHPLLSEARPVLECLERENLRGIVPSHLLPFIDLKNVHSDRIPSWIWNSSLSSSLASSGRVDFILVTPEFPRYEMSRRDVTRFLAHAESSPQIKPYSGPCLKGSPKWFSLFALNLNP